MNCRQEIQALDISFIIRSSKQIMHDLLYLVLFTPCGVYGHYSYSPSHTVLGCCHCCAYRLYFLHPCFFTAVKRFFLLSLPFWIPIQCLLSYAAVDFFSMCGQSIAMPFFIVCICWILIGAIQKLFVCDFSWLPNCLVLINTWVNFY